MRLRGYQKGDIEAMYRLDQLCFSPAFQFSRATIEDSVEAPSAVNVVAEDDGGEEMLGFLIIEVEGPPSDRYAYIITIDVAPEKRQCGIGKAMLSEAEAQARSAGADRIGLHVAIDNAGAIRFYESQQYERIGVARQFYSEAGLDALVYAKPL